MRWEISAEKLVTEGGGSKAEIAWSHIIKALERKQGYLLFFQKRLAYWLPKSAMEKEDIIQLERFFVMKNIARK